MPFTTIHVTQEALRGYWQEVRKGLEVVAAKAVVDWIPEDIYTALRTGNATLHMVFDGPTYVGFYILSQRTEFDGRKSLLVWVAYSTVPESTEYGMREIEQFARRTGYPKLVFYSSRRAWERRLKATGWHVAEIKFEKDLTR